MKSDSSCEVIHKDVVVIGNGPSGLALSYMLSGHIPYLISNTHPDEFLSARLSMATNESLVHQDLEQLASGLEGRSTNPISLLLDALSHPYADVGLELESLIEWRKEGVEIDHVVLGKGPPGGSWHKMDPHILTLSLGAWMALPGLPYKMRDGSEKRASAGNVARYYVQYMKEMNLGKYFKNGICVTNVKQIKDFPSPVIEHPIENITDNVFGEYCDPTIDKKKEYLHNKWVERVEDDVCERTKLCSTPETEESAHVEQRRKKVCSLSNAFNFIRLRSNRKCKRRRDCLLKNDLSPDRKIREVLQKTNPINRDQPWKLVKTIKEDHVNEIYPKSVDICRNNGKGRSISFSCDYDNFESSCDSLCSNSYKEQGSFINSYNLDLNSSITTSKVPEALNDCDNNYDSLRLKESNCDPCTSSVSKCNKIKEIQTKWLIETYDTISGKYVTYICKRLVLANGASDLPNRLTISDNTMDPAWLVHDVRSLEMELDLYLSNNSTSPDPVLVIGAGLSAADAIIATRCRNIPVLHVYRNKTSDLSKQLPENMYPEYHKVHQMMQDGGSSYPLYQALPECTPIEFDEKERIVTLRTKSGDNLKYHVSFAAVLIGAQPDLTFLPQHFRLGVNKNLPIDSKTNNVDINKLTHSVNGFDGLYAMGPLAGDNFVRFIPGGALAIISDLYRKYGY
ncbi:hypothetical protein ILUMI_01173 [Ignelater luminosus]|uniref:Oxidative stress-induced growth inhibitor 2 n=1 Tax=Ignelater luminosus TaxID=2038154 RepID=A0A8K0DR83_IGNLU|nr:hypothetical protein ILUMI_01173 [Ignelater luminosus]